MRIQKAAVGWLVMFCLMCVANTGQAQLLKRLFGTKDTGQVSSSCPGGICPTASAPAAYQSAPVANVVQMPFKAVDNARGHWSYPGTIDSHLESTHGVSTAGMSRQEKLNLHDSLHEGTAQNVSVSVPRANYVAPFESHYSSYTTSSGGGSSGGSSGSLAVGKYYKGELVTSIGEAYSVDQPSESKAISSLGSRRDFRRELLSQAKQAQASGTISSEELQATERLLRVPGVAMMLEARAGRAGAVDWETLFEKLLPLILELIKLFSANDVPTAMDMPKSIYVSFPMVASTIESFEPLPLTI